MKCIDKIKQTLEEIAPDVEKLEVKKVKAAAARVRKGLQAITKICKEGRQEAQDLKASC